MCTFVSESVVILFFFCTISFLSIYVMTDGDRMSSAGPPNKRLKQTVLNFGSKASQKGLFV